MDDKAFRLILARFGLSWQGYARVRKSVKKRLVRHMQVLGCSRVEDYIARFDDVEVVREVERLLTVSISHFFRDMCLWRILRENVFPLIVERSAECVDIWSAGCATGQEVYSLSIFWEYFRKEVGTLPKLRILATDMNSEYIDVAKRGVYEASSVKNVPDDIKRSFFRIFGNPPKYEILPSLKENIEWHVHDFVKQPLPKRIFHMIFLRNNLFTYYCREIQEEVWTKVLDRLMDGGFLVIGRKETLPFGSPDVQPFQGCTYIFEKRWNEEDLNVR